MAFIENDGNKLFYEIEGQGDRSLVFIHGLCGDHRVWSKNIPFFNSKHRVAAIDLFGHGHSSKSISPKHAFESLPSVLEILIEKEELQNVVLIGHSIAGNILLSCIERSLKNAAGYVFVDCTFNANEQVVNSRNQLADSLLQSSDDQRKTAVANWYETMMDMNAAPKDNELILLALRNLEAKWVFEFMKTTNFIRQAPKTSLPVFISESDRLTKDKPERSFHKVFPDVEYSHWPVSNHFFFVYEAEKFNRQLQKFLDTRIIAKD